ncbi:MAG TPA: GrpB family protein, partial [Candidatus Acidoferrum sp.]|nr:GrpB family protein [Candidatus Acidoferrum sp.]
MSSRIMIADYDPRWPEQFETLRSRIAAALGDLAIAIEHIGSTAVPGLAAKPVIDIDVLMRSDADLSLV